MLKLRYFLLGLLILFLGYLLLLYGLPLWFQTIVIASFIILLMSCLIYGKLKDFKEMLFLSIWSAILGTLFVTSIIPIEVVDNIFLKMQLMSFCFIFNLGQSSFLLLKKHKVFE